MIDNWTRKNFLSWLNCLLGFCRLNSTVYLQHYSVGCWWRIVCKSSLRNLSVEKSQPTMLAQTFSKIIYQHRRYEKFYINWMNYTRCSFCGKQSKEAVFLISYCLKVCNEHDLQHRKIFYFSLKLRFFNYYCRSILWRCGRLQLSINLVLLVIKRIIRKMFWSDAVCLQVYNVCLMYLRLSHVMVGDCFANVSQRLMKFLILQ